MNDSKRRLHTIVHTTHHVACACTQGLSLLAERGLSLLGLSLNRLSQPLPPSVPELEAAPDAAARGAAARAAAGEALRAMRAHLEARLGTAVLERALALAMEGAPRPAATEASVGGGSGSGGGGGGSAETWRVWEEGRLVQLGTLLSLSRMPPSSQQQPTPSDAEHAPADNGTDDADDALARAVLGLAISQAMQVGATASLRAKTGKDAAQDAIGGLGWWES